VEGVLSGDWGKAEIIEITLQLDLFLEGVSQATVSWKQTT
jgi:hypothetical protein